MNVRRTVRRAVAVGAVTVAIGLGAALPASAERAAPPTGGGNGGLTPSGGWGGPLIAYDCVFEDGEGEIHVVPNGQSEPVNDQVGDHYLATCDNGHPSFAPLKPMVNPKDGPNA